MERLGDPLRWEHIELLLVGKRMYAAAHLGGQERVGGIQNSC